MNFNFQEKNVPSIYPKLSLTLAIHFLFLFVSPILDNKAKEQIFWIFNWKFQFSEKRTFTPLPDMHTHVCLSEGVPSSSESLIY